MDKPYDKRGFSDEDFNYRLQMSGCAGIQLLNIKATFVDGDREIWV